MKKNKRTKEFFEKEKKKNKKLLKTGILLMVLAPILYVVTFGILGFVYCNITGNSFF